jgi:hypothetical protein
LGIWRRTFRDFLLQLSFWPRHSQRRFRVFSPLNRFRVLVPSFATFETSHPSSTNINVTTINGVGCWTFGTADKHWHLERFYIGYL